MSLTSPNIPAPGRQNRDAADHAHLRHGRDRLLGVPIGRYLQPAPMLFTRDGHNVFLGDAYRGASAFLMCSGPSLKLHDLARLEQRGLLVCAVNNAATIVRPQLWVSVDDPGNFCDAIWRDPAIWKFVPLCHMEKRFTVRAESGELVESTEVVGDMPAVFGYRRNEAFVAEQWLHEDTFNWGNHSERVDAYGIQGSRSVMLVALRLLFFLGVRRVYLLGCDFHMTYGSQNYAFEQDRSRSSVNGNNGSYVALNTRLEHLQPYFAEEGFEVLNCTPHSGLKVFPYCDYEQAVRQSLATFPGKIVTTGMYDRKARTSGGHASDTVSPQPTLATSVSLSEDPVAAQSLPEITLMTAVDRSNVETFRWTWQTWMTYRAALRRMPVIVLHDPSEGLEGELRSIIGEPGALQLIAAAPSPAQLGRDRWSHAYLRTAADQVETPWYLRLDPEAVASQYSQWLRPKWFQPNEEGRTAAFVAHPWGYSRPADILSQLDDWGQEIDGLNRYPPLKIPHPSGAEQVRHEAISSWFFLSNREWTKALVDYAPERLPCSSHDTFTWYCAARCQTPFIRWPMKSLGWEHSFSRRWSARERAREVLAGVPAPGT